MRSTYRTPERRVVLPSASPETDLATPSLKLQVRLLGPMTLMWAGTPVRLATAAARALIALLALRGRPQFREAIAAELWPDSGGRSSAALRQALWVARAALQEAGAEPAAIVDADDVLIGLNPERVDVDAARFEQLVTSRPRMLEEAVALYRGELSLTCRQECFERERDRLADLFEDALADLARLRLQAHDFEGARDASLALLARDPIREEGHATLIEVYGRTGSRSQVVRQYRRLCSVLESELSVPPLPETEATYREALGSTYSRSLAASRSGRA